MRLMCAARSVWMVATDGHANDEGSACATPQGNWRAQSWCGSARQKHAVECSSKAHIGAARGTFVDDIVNMRSSISTFELLQVPRVSMRRKPTRLLVDARIHQWVSQAPTLSQVIVLASRILTRSLPRQWRYVLCFHAVLAQASRLGAVERSSTKE